MNETKVSIIVPVFQAEKFLIRTVRSLLDQTLKDIEIILVDDGSSDWSSVVCDQFTEEDTRVIVVHSQNFGVSNARNMGLKTAKSEYLLFCDADDIPDRTMAGKLYKTAIREQSECVLCSFEKVTDEKRLIDSLPFNRQLTHEQEILDSLVMPMLVWGYAPGGERYQGVYGSVWRALYSTDRVRKTHLEFDTEIHLGEDLLFNLAFWPGCSRISFVKEPLYQYVENSSSATHTNATVMWRQYLSVWKKAHLLLSEFNADPERLRWHNYQLTRYGVSAIIEGICSQAYPVSRKIQLIKSILKDDLLHKSRRQLPKALGRKEQILCALLSPPFAMLVWAYYQRKVSVITDTRI